MRRLLIVTVATLFALILAAPTALAGSAHFINNAFSITRADNTLTVSGQGSGSRRRAADPRVLSATALCINPGGNHPKAVNKHDLTAEGDFPRRRS